MNGRIANALCRVHAGKVQRVARDEIALAAAAVDIRPRHAVRQRNGIVYSGATAVAWDITTYNISAYLAVYHLDGVAIGVAVLVTTTADDMCRRGAVVL